MNLYEMSISQTFLVCPNTSEPCNSGALFLCRLSLSCSISRLMRLLRSARSPTWHWTLALGIRRLLRLEGGAIGNAAAASADVQRERCADTNSITCAAKCGLFFCTCSVACLPNTPGEPWTCYVSLVPSVCFLMRGWHKSRSGTRVGR